SGYLTVIGTNPCGNGTVSPNYPITVNQLPDAAGTITGLAAVCEGLTGVNYFVPLITGATGYNWTLPSGVVITDGTNANSILVNFPSGSVSGNITVTGTNTCGSGVTSLAFAVTVSNYTSLAGNISGTPTVCQGQTSVVYSVQTIPEATSYIWAYSGTGATINGTTNNITVTFSSTATSGNLTVMGTNSCGNGTVSVNYPIAVNSVPAASGIINGTASVCQGQTAVSYSVAAITNATSYTWAYSGSGATISGTTNNITVTFATNATSGNLTVMGTNSCGNGTVSANYPITVNPLPAAAGIISGLSPVCRGLNTVSYSVAAITNATSYTWAYSGSGATINGTTNNITINFSANATSGNLTVMGHNDCGNGIISANYP
ncbi:MAG: hypothetical protein Q7J06_10850, partial [Bacteroidales bacterium]|nr:hypothetical protein [Bacteroidales bacterium]